MADSEYIRPTSDTATVNLEIWPASPATHYDKVIGEDMGSYVKRTWANWQYDRYNLANPVYRGTDIKKIRLFALGKRNNPVGAQGCFSIDSGGVYNTTKKAWGGYGTSVSKWEAWTFKLNPNTSLAWTLSELDALSAGVGHYDSGIPSGAVTWEYFIAVIWTEAAVQADAITDYDGSVATLNGTILQSEGNFLTKMTYGLVLTQTRVRFNWGTDTSYGTNTAWQYLVSGSFEADISGLDPAVMYHYRAEIQVRDNDQNFESFYSDDKFIATDRVYVWLGDEDDKEKAELTTPANAGLRGVMSVSTEIGWDVELQQASAGIAQLVCDNHLGDYSPEKAAGFFYGDLDLGKRITVYEIYLGNKYDHFTGRIDKITPHAEHDNPVAFILVVDGMDELAQLEINTVLRTNTETGELAADILDAASWPAGAAYRDLDTGADTLQLGWFHKMKGLVAFRLLEAIENGRFYVGPSGKAIWENRYARLAGDGLISQHDFEDTMVELAYEYSKQLVYNQFTVRGRRYYIGGVQLVSGYDMGTLEDELVYSAHTGDSGAPYIPQNSSLTLRAEFGAPLESYDSLASGTHWNANTSPAKTGTDVTANISLAQTQYGQSIKLVFTNSGNQGAYLVVPDSPPVGAPSARTILVYGILYSEEVMAITEEDAANPFVTKKSLEIDARFKSNPNDLLAYAQFIKAKYKDAVPRAVTVRHTARTAWPDDTIRLQCLTRHISDRITLKSTLLGFDTDYFINKVVQEYLIGQGGFEHETTWSVERITGNYEGVYWLLGVVGYSELGETTVLGF